MPEDAGSVRIVLPSAYEFVATPGPGRRGVAIPSGPIRVGGGLSADEESAVLAGLEQGKFRVVEDREAAPRPEVAARRAMRGPVDEKLQVHVDLAPDEDAVLLLEQDGVYAWKTDYVERPPVAAATVRRGGANVAASRTVTFEVAIDPQPGAAPTRSLKSFLFGGIRTIVLTFIARRAAGVIADHLEEDIHRGLVHMRGDSAADWVDVASLGDLDVATKAAPRLLLFVHGTFSSTRGSFGALAESPWGKTFMAAAHAQYDAVVGFDHSTLRDDPKTNATELLRLLREVPWKQPPGIDVVTFSRGGLAYRSLVEQLLPGSGFAPRFERSIFVAVPNAGTHLADPKNWRDLVDLYTNLSAALFRILGAFPQTKVASTILSEAINIIGGLVKALTSAAADGDAVPGLAAMNPDGPFIAQLNEVSPDAPTIAGTYYCYVTSNFEADAKAAPPKEIPPKLWLRLADGFVDRLLDSATSDLVVDTKSVPQIDVAAGRYIKEFYEFPANSYCYHTNYFTRPEVVGSLTTWLRLTRPAHAVRGIRPGLTTIEVPPGFDTDITLANAKDRPEELKARIEHEAPSYVVVQRWWNDQKLHYAFPAEEVLQRIDVRPGATSVLDALDLHESDASQEAGLAEVTRPRVATSSAERSIIFTSGHPIAVSAAPITIDVGELARVATAPASAEERVLQRRVMPTFAPTQRRGIGRGVPQQQQQQQQQEQQQREAPPPPAAAPPPPPIYHFLAQMDRTVEVKKPVTIDVTISREQVAAAAGKAADGGAAPLERDRKLILELRPRKNFEAGGVSRLDLDVASLGEESTYYFDVIPTDVGEGEVRVVARQGQTPLLTMTLKATIVEKLTRPSTRTSAEGSAGEPPPSKPFHKLTIWENERGGETVLTFELEAPELGLFDKWLSAPITGARDVYVRKLYKELESCWAQNADDADQFLTQVRAYGMRLFDQLIPEALRKTLWEKRDAMKSIMIVSEEPFLPWELLHLHAPDKKTLPEEVLFLGQLGVVRWLHGSWPPDRLRLRDVRYVIPDYPVSTYVLPNAGDERKFLEQELGAKPVTPQFKDVRDLLATPDGFDVVHFACHGDNDPEQIDARLMLQGRLEGENYFPSLLPATVVSAVSRFAENGRHPIVVLNACQVGSQRLGLTTLGGFAQAFLGAGAGAFVAPLWSVGDREATVFARTLYAALKAGKSMSEAAVTAREAARMEPQADASWLAYAVYGYPHAQVEGA